MHRFKQLRAENIHMVGIGGSGMFPLAQILCAEGYRISGSDNNPSATLDAEKKLDMTLYLGHSPENVRGADLVVYSAAISSSNPELVAARELGIPTMERAELLGIIANSFAQTVAICGTHGKTTTTSMLTEVLMKSGKDPSAVIGGKLASIGGSGRVGSGEYMTCEACEFRNTYLSIYPYIALILNIDEDHLEFFGNIDNIISSFTEFATHAKGFVIANGDDENTLKAVHAAKKPTILFGCGENCAFRAVNITESGQLYSYDCVVNGKTCGRVNLKIPGRHNVFNSVGVIAAAAECGVSVEDAVKYVSEFKGAGRRFEIIGNFGGFTVADDYAHNPTELAATLSTAKKMDYSGVVAVFQPVTYSRTKLMLNELAQALKIADKVILTPILGSREINTYGIDSADLAALIPGAVLCDGFESAAEQICKTAKPGELVMTLGCGDIYKVMPYVKELTAD